MLVQKALGRENTAIEDVLGTVLQLTWFITIMVNMVI